MLRQISLFIFLVLVLSGCEDAFTTVIDADPPPFTRKMVVHSYCEDTPDTLQFLTLETNRNIFDADDQILPILDATIEVLEDGALKGFFQYVPSPDKNNYRTEQQNLFSKIGGEYTIRIKAPGFPVCETRQFLPVPVTIDDALFVKELTVDEDGERVDGFKVTFKDLPEAGDYYLLECYFKENPSYRINLKTNDPFLQAGINGTIMISDAGNNGFDQTFSMYTEYSWLSDPTVELVFVLQHISLDLYHYLISIDKYENNDIDFFSEPAFVNSNVKNGLGIFSLSSKTKKEVRK